MIEVCITLSDTHRAVISEGNFALEVEGASLFEEPLEIAFAKIETLFMAAGIAKEELSGSSVGEPAYEDED